MVSFKVESVTFCDDIRAEINGKFALLGAFAPDVTVNQIPSVISCALFVVGAPSSDGPFDLEFRAVDHEGAEMIKGGLAGNFHGTRKTSIPIGAFLLKVEKEGLFSFELKFGDGKWSKIGGLRVRFLKPASES